MGMAAPIYWTADMVRQLPDDGNRYEVVYGELLVTPAPRLNHQLLVSRLAVAVAKYLEHEPVGVMLTSPADISWGQDVLVQPDVFIVSTGLIAEAPPPLLNEPQRARHVDATPAVIRIGPGLSEVVRRLQNPLADPRGIPMALLLHEKGR